MASKDTIKRFVAQYKPLEKAMFHLYRIRNGKTAKAEINARAKADLFAVKKLAVELPYYPQERVIDNNLYGYARALKNYASLTSDLQAYMEHGLFLGGVVHPDQHHWHFKKIITLSEKRVAVLNNALPSKKAVAIGPYIHYASPFLNHSEFGALKKKLGSVLLVFPFHSMKGVEASFELDQLIDKIKSVAKDFNTVIISLYYLDAQNEATVSAYYNAGFKVVTAGHKYDPNFVKRQRTHIELADMTMSNGMGTQTGYCIYLQKPHYIFEQLVSQKNSKAEARRHSAQTNLTVKERVAQERQFFGQLFGEYSDTISTNQYRHTSEYWGFKNVKTKEEIQNLFRD